MSITKIADMVGVSYVTVSRALNNPEKVKPSTLAKIRKACMEVDFTPRVIPNRLKTVTCLIPMPDNRYTPDSTVTQNIVSALNKRYYHAVFSPIEGINDVPAIFQSAFIALVHNDLLDNTFIRQLAAKVPFVVINDTNENLGPDTILVGSDHKQGVELALNHFYKKGHRRIGYIGIDLKTRGHRERYECYKRFMEKHKDYDPSLVYINNEELLLQGVKRLCEQQVTGIFVSSDHLAQKVCYYLKILGKEIPNDVSIITPEVSGSMEYLYPSLTAISQPVERVAETAVDLCITALNKPKAKLKKAYYIPYVLIERESVKILN